MSSLMIFFCRPKVLRTGGRVGSGVDQSWRRMILQRMNLGGGIGAGGAGTEGSGPGEEGARGVGAGKCYVSCHRRKPC